MDFFKKTDNGDMITLTETDFIEYVTSVDNLNNMGKATMDIEGLVSNVDLLDILDSIKNQPTTNREWGGVIDRAVSYIKADREKGEPDPEKKAIRELIKKISSVVECTSNTYYMAPHSSTFKDCLAEIACDPDKNAEYTRLVGVDADVVYNDIYQFLNPSIMDLIITKASKLDSMDNFSYSSADHASNIFDL